MFDFENLIGFEASEAKQVLAKNGYNKTEIIINSRKNELCDTLLVTKAEEKDGVVRLICGDFYLNVKG